MRSRLVIYAVATVVAAAALIGAVAVAAADSSPALPPLTAAELLGKMAAADARPASLSGEISWRNGLFGDVEAAAALAQMPAQSPLLSSGSGRLWVSSGGLRVESQGAGGDQVLVVDHGTRTAWIYDHVKDTARRFVLEGDVGVAGPSPTPMAALTPDAIAGLLQRLAPCGTVDVAGQATVAGRAAYLLRFTPAADDTALGVVVAAVDGETVVPLRLEVYAKGGGEAVLRLGFDSVSLAPVDPALFRFTPPPGATMTTETVDGGELAREAEQAHARGSNESDPRGAGKVEWQELVRRALLTREEVAGVVLYDLGWARGYETRPYRAGFVLTEGGPLTAAAVPLAQLLGAASADPVTGDGAGSARGPASVLVYGDGLGAITLLQTATTPELEKQLEQLPQMFTTMTIAGAKAQVVGTPLGGAIVWRQGGTTLVAAGLVPMGDLQAFAASVR